MYDTKLNTFFVKQRKMQIHVSADFWLVSKKLFLTSQN